MRNRKTIAAVASVVLILGLALVLFWHYRTKDATVAVTSPGSVALQPGASSDESKTVPLSQTDSAAKTAESTGLKVLPAQGSGQTGLGQQSSNATNGSSDGGLSKSVEDDFSQYEKYKDQANALYAETKIGDGSDVVPGKKVAVYYKGWLTSGQLFDQTNDGSPFVFIPGDHRVIAGWEEGVIGMKVGGKRRLIVPPAVGYGSTGKDPIPANAVMVFDIEVVAVEP